PSKVFSGHKLPGVNGAVWRYVTGALRQLGCLRRSRDFHWSCSSRRCSTRLSHFGKSASKRDLSFLCSFRSLLRVLLLCHCIRCVTVALLFHLFKQFCIVIIRLSIRAVSPDRIACPVENFLIGVCWRHIARRDHFRPARAADADLLAACCNRLTVARQDFLGQSSVGPALRI